jgi:O-antigen ligase
VIALRRHLSLRTVILLGAAGFAVIAASGLVEAEAFTLPTTLKYCLTVAAPLVVFAAALMNKPLHLITGLTIVAAPFVGETAELAGERVSLLVPLLLAGFALVVLSEVDSEPRSALHWAGWLAFPLLLIPLAAGSENHEFIVALALLLAIAWLVSKTAVDESGLRAVLTAVVIQAAIQAGIALWESRTGHTLNLYGSAGTSQSAGNYTYAYGNFRQPSGVLNDPISLANVLAISVPMIAVMLLTARSWMARLPLIVVLAGVVTALSLTLDRASWIGVGLGVTVGLVLLPRVVRRRAIPYALLGVVAILAVVVAVAGPMVTGRFSTILDPTSTQGKNSLQAGEAEGELARVQLWDIAWHDGFLDHPFGGIGIDNIGPLIRDHSSSSGAGVKATTAIYANAASTYLQLAAEAGLFAVALFGLLLTCMYSDLRAGLRAYPVLGAGLAAAAIALLVCWVTDIVIYYEATAACVGVLFGAVAATGRAGRRLGGGSDAIA